MKIQLSSPLVLLLLPALTTAADLNSAKQNADLSSGSSQFNSRYVSTDAESISAAKGSQDVPVDGKDGRPHAGPWVETNAERDRKSKGSDDIDLVSTKYNMEIPSSEHLSTGEGKVIPHSNGGVMDDPDRAGPKAGTRGTEGGVSEKKKENQYEKVPGSPKEAPPLLQSEKQKQPSNSDATVRSGSRTADDAGTLGMLEVRSTTPSANGSSGSNG